MYRGQVEKAVMLINAVDGEGFHELLNYTDPGYRIPLRSTITSCTEKQYKVKKNMLKTQLLSATKTGL